MFDAQELIDRFRDLVQEDASDTRRRKLIHSYYRQITLQDVDPDRKLYDRYLKAGRKALIRYLKAGRAAGHSQEGAGRQKPQIYRERSETAVPCTGTCT